MTNPAFSLENLNDHSVAVRLPADVASMLEKEAKANRRTVAAVLREWLEDQADGREAAKRLKSLRSGKTKAIPAAQVYADLGL